MVGAGLAPALLVIARRLLPHTSCSSPINANPGRARPLLLLILRAYKLHIFVIQHGVFFLQPLELQDCGTTGALWSAAPLRQFMFDTVLPGIRALVT
jgi:hypothetical protein